MHEFSGNVCAAAVAYRKHKSAMVENSARMAVMRAIVVSIIIMYLYGMQ